MEITHLYIDLAIGKDLGDGKRKIEIRESRGTKVNWPLNDNARGDLHNALDIAIDDLEEKLDWAMNRSTLA